MSNVKAQMPKMLRILDFDIYLTFELFFSNSSNKD
jgi:hypothetical protein